MTVIPKIIIETLPAEVRLKGIESFERIGEEDTSMLGHRRGGPIEIVLRRPKFVVRTAKHSPSAPEPETPAESEPCITVLEHEVASVPEDAGFKANPFVDGAIVRYTPESASEVDDCAVFVAPLAERPIARSMVDASLLAHLLVGKLDYHTPYYRQEVKAARMGYPVSRTNMARWQFEAGAVARRITDAMWDEALARSWFGMDATGTAIQDEPEYRYGHVFVLVAPGDGVLFRYTPKYDSATVQQLFGGFTGVVVADASANHNVLFGPGKATEAGCWSHARKRFVKALRAGEGKDAAFVLSTIQALFRIEKKIALAGADSRLEVRQSESAPLVEALYQWVDERLPEVRTDDSLLRKGLVYLENQRKALHEFLFNGEIPIHNNASERALRRIVKGRANWLKHGSDEHAMCACAISSLIASCPLHGLDPELYLQEVLTVAPSWPLSRMLELSPKNWVSTRQRLIAEGRLTYIDLAHVAGSRIAFRAS
jgi:transposase